MSDKLNTKEEELEEEKPDPNLVWQEDEELPAEGSEAGEKLEDEDSENDEESEKTGKKEETEEESSEDEEENEK